MRLTLLQSLLAPMRAAVLAQRRMAVIALEHWRRRKAPDDCAATLELPMPTGAGVRAPVLALRPLLPLTLTEMRAEWRWCPDAALPPEQDLRGAGAPMALSGRLHRARRRCPDAADPGFEVSVSVRRTSPTEGMLRLQQALTRVGEGMRR